VESISLLGDKVRQHGAGPRSRSESSEHGRLNSSTKGEVWGKCVGDARDPKVSSKDTHTVLMTCERRGSGASEKGEVSRREGVVDLIGWTIWGELEGEKIK